MTITRSSKFLVQWVAVCFLLLCVGHVVSGRAFAAQSTPAKQGADQSGATDDPFKKPLTLESYKSFFVGGERVKRPDGTLGMTGHLYVEAFIPVNAKSTPIVMLHTTTSGTNFLGRANGEEGWATMFARAGYPVYVIDPPGTGRAGVDLTVNDKSKIKQGDSAEWASRKHGPEFSKAGFNPDPKEDSTPHSDPMNQMPTDTDGVNNWLAMQMTYSFDLGRRVRNAALIALLEKIGRPVIWMGWSGGGELAQQLVLERPELFKAIAGLEGCRQTPDIPAFIDTLASRHIPMLHVNADYSKWTALCQARNTCRPRRDVCRPSMWLLRSGRKAGTRSQSICRILEFAGMGTSSCYRTMLTASPGFMWIGLARTSNSGPAMSFGSRVTFKITLLTN
jgi:pimeloyl-ACP methyl ester carboxylesterase